MEGAGRVTATLLKVCQEPRTSRDSVKPHVCVEVASFEPDKLARAFDVDGAPKRVSTVQDGDGGVAPFRSVPGEEGRLMKPVDEDRGARAKAT